MIEIIILLAHRIFFVINSVIMSILLFQVYDFKSFIQKMWRPFIAEIVEIKQYRVRWANPSR